MKKILGSVIMLVLVQTFVFGQSTNEEINIVHITFNEDSLLFAESYEINLSKKKVYSLNPNASYLHIKGGKRILHTVGINKDQWKSISELIPIILSIEQLNNIQFNKDSNYFISTYNGISQVHNYSFQKSNVPTELEELFKIIRNQSDETQ
jgi:hypothetical protein